MAPLPVADEVRGGEVEMYRRRWSGSFPFVLTYPEDTRGTAPRSRRLRREQRWSACEILRGLANFFALDSKSLPRYPRPASQSFSAQRYAFLEPKGQVNSSVRASAAWRYCFVAVSSESTPGFAQSLSSSASSQPFSFKPSSSQLYVPWSIPRNTVIPTTGHQLGHLAGKKGLFPDAGRSTAFWVPLQRSNTPINLSSMKPE